MALLTWKASLNMQRYSLLSSWRSGTAPCRWRGITCDNSGTVTSLNLASAGQEGTLRSFNFSSFPTLTILDLYNNALFGPIPPLVSNLFKLTYLCLSRNQFSGSIPSEISLLFSTLNSFGNLGNLTALNLSQNSLSGLIPPTIGNLSKLTILTLHQNQLSGSIPPQVGRLKELVLLRLWRNRLNGSIPQEISNLTNLYTLHLGDNMLTGSLPENLCSTGLLKIFTSYNNYLAGSIGTSLRNCTNLFRVRLEQSQLKAFGVYPYLNYIDLSSNNFDGELSQKWGQSRHLAGLKVSNNRISGRIPRELGQAIQLGELNLSSNALEGEIRKELGNLASLFMLNLENKKLSGGIPSETGRLLKLVELNLAVNRLSGPIPPILSECYNLLQLNLSRNRFSEAIPLQIGYLQSPQTLDLSQNFLRGEIHQQLAVLRMLVTLNLSHNNLSGLIPPCFDNLVSLLTIDLSYNHLEGPLPNNRAFSGLHSNHSEIIKACVGILLRGNKLVKGTHFEPLSTIRRCIKCGEAVGKLIFEATDGLSSKHRIDEGGHGTLYKAELQNVLIIAVKKVHQEVKESSSTYYKAYENEICALREIQHCNIVKRYGFGRHAKHIFLAYKFMERGSLRKILSNDEEAMKLDWGKRVDIVKGVASALSYMHHDCYPPLIHRDISSSNVLLNSEFEAHISDFGSSMRVLDYDDTFNNWTRFTGTVGYAAPELAQSVKGNEKCDVYSFGVVAKEVIMGRHPGDLVGLRSLMLGNRTPLNNVLDQRLRLPFHGNMAEEVVSVLNLAFYVLASQPSISPNNETNQVGALCTKID
ncbi:hypothetical protein LguiB_019722 [Lonicera macranthoides]